MRDHHRVVRIALCIDEACSFARELRRGDGNPVQPRDTITHDEYRICGGGCHTTTKKEFSFYRQLVLAKRDARTMLSSARHPFRRKAFTKALELYEFYPDDDDLAVVDPHRRGNNRRVAKVLAKVRVSFRATRGTDLAHDDTYKELVLAKRYLKQTMEARRSPEFESNEPSWSESDDENVDHLDDAQKEDDEDDSSAAELVD